VLTAHWDGCKKARQVSLPGFVGVVDRLRLGGLAAAGGSEPGEAKTQQ